MFPLAVTTRLARTALCGARDVTVSLKNGKMRSFALRRGGSEAVGPWPVCRQFWQALLERNDRGQGRNPWKTMRSAMPEHPETAGRAMRSAPPPPPWIKPDSRGGMSVLLPHLAAHSALNAKDRAGIRRLSSGSKVLRCIHESKKRKFGPRPSSTAWHKGRGGPRQRQFRAGGQQRRRTVRFSSRVNKNFWST
jgi:hypothetical protein